MLLEQENEKNVLHSSFKTVMDNYATILAEVKETNNYQHEFRNIIANDIPNLLNLKCEIEYPYKVKGSYGKGRWTDIPWIAIFDVRITTSAKNGVYIVYIFNKDTKELFLTLNQGVTAVAKNILDGVEDESTFVSVLKTKNQDAEKRLKSRAVYIRNILKLDEVLDIECGSSLYDAGCIYGIKYDIENLPEDKKLVNDLRYVLELYKRYYQFWITEKEMRDYSLKVGSIVNEFMEFTQNEENNKLYSKEQFLKEVFMSEEEYDLLSGLLMSKKNIILQGAPGVGKTFLAKRLAYSIIGCEDKERVQMIQFHQSYSYEDFIVGYRPNGVGFQLEYGPFYEFCKQAEGKKEPYFFIIDEINRGNVSKIFGELLMLIEKDKREESLKLLYTKEKFSVPENVYIIGMMNTADRSLAIIDYALRRRFAFYEVKPAFDNSLFIEMTSKKDSSTLNRLLSYVKKLNVDIVNDDSLGNGFEVGHSYFCTSSDTQIDKKWIKSTVEYELIPLIKEYWFDDKEKVEEWSSKLRGVEND